MPVIVSTMFTGTPALCKFVIPPMPQAVNHKSRICEIERRDKVLEPLTDRITIAVIPTPASRVRELQFDSWSYAYHVVSNVRNSRFDWTFHCKKRHGASSCPMF